AVRLLERGHLLRLRIDREERVVRARVLERRRIEQPVRAEQLRALAGRLQLLPEGLSLGRELPRDVDDLRVARDLRDRRREVRRLLADRVTRDVDTVRLQVRLDRVGEALRVRLLVVDDVDLLRLQGVDDVLADRRAL